MRLLAPPAGPEITDEALCRLHHMLYEDEKTTSEEVLYAIIDALERARKKPWGSTTVLLGSHAADEGGGWGTEGSVDGSFIRAIRDIVERWPPPESPIRGRSLGAVLSRADVTPDRPGVVLATLRRALLGAATNRTPGASVACQDVSVQDVVPSASDRRAAIVRHMGSQPLLYWRPAQVRGGRMARARVYIDVSGSMAPFVPFLYGALVALRRHVEGEVLLFSTTVTSIALKDLQRGRVDTTGGTESAV